VSEITLANLGGGAAIEKVQEELGRVVENILDPNTNATASRSIVLTITFKPAKDRSFGDVEVATQAKLAPSTAFSTRAFFGADKEGKHVAFEDNPKQVTIQDFLDQKNNVAPIEGRKVEVAK